MDAMSQDARSQDEQANEIASADISTPAALEPHSEPEPSLSPATEQIKPRGIAPIWHTLVLILAILAFSIWGSKGATSGPVNPFAPVQNQAHQSQVQQAANGTDSVRLIRYSLTGILELLVVGWVALGLRMRKVPFRSLFGKWPRGLNDITKEAAIAAAFWFCSMIVLVSIAITWGLIQNQIYKQQSANSSSASSSSKPGPTDKSPQQQQAELIHQLTQLAPANGVEIAAWGLLCLIVGFSEELTFRGYLQSQGIALLRNIPVAVVLTSIVFGAAHGYQGLRGIVLISVYGALFSCITLLRKNLFPGMLAHAWHDFATGMLLALIRATHFLDHLPTTPTPHR
jgi:membrane protease YdiL (CAAX protease family)